MAGTDIDLDSARPVRFYVQALLALAPIKGATARSIVPVDAESNDEFRGHLSNAMSASISAVKDAAVNVTEAATCPCDVDAGPLPPAVATTLLLEMQQHTSGQGGGLGNQRLEHRLATLRGSTAARIAGGASAGAAAVVAASATSAGPLVVAVSRKDASHKAKGGAALCGLACTTVKVGVAGDLATAVKQAIAIIVGDGSLLRNLRRQQIPVRTVAFAGATSVLREEISDSEIAAMRARPAWFTRHIGEQLRNLMEDRAAAAMELHLARHLRRIAVQIADARVAMANSGVADEPALLALVDRLQLEQRLTSLNLTVASLELSRLNAVHSARTSQDPGAVKRTTAEVVSARGGLEEAVREARLKQRSSVLANDGAQLESQLATTGRVDRYNGDAVDGNGTAAANAMRRQSIQGQLANIHFMLHRLRSEQVVEEAYRGRLERMRAELHACYARSAVSDECPRMQQRLERMVADERERAKEAGKLAKSGDRCALCRVAVVAEIERASNAGVSRKLLPRYMFSYCEMRLSLAGPRDSLRPRDQIDKVCGKLQTMLQADLWRSGNATEQLAKTRAQNREPHGAGASAETSFLQVGWRARAEEEAEAVGPKKKKTTKAQEGGGGSGDIAVSESEDSPVAIAGATGDDAPVKATPVVLGLLRLNFDKAIGAYCLAIRGCLPPKTAFQRGPRTGCERCASAILGWVTNTRTPMSSDGDVLALAPPAAKATGSDGAEPPTVAPVAVAGYCRLRLNDRWRMRRDLINATCDTAVWDHKASATDGIDTSAMVDSDVTVVKTPKLFKATKMNDVDARAKEDLRSSFQFCLAVGECSASEVKSQPAFEMGRAKMLAENTQKSLGSVEAALAALRRAEAALNLAKEALAAAHDAMNKAQGVVDALQNQLNAKKAELDAARAKLDALKGETAAAEREAAAALKAKQEAERVLNAATARLNALKAKCARETKEAEESEKIKQARVTDKLSKKVGMINAELADVEDRLARAKEGGDNTEQLALEKKVEKLQADAKAASDAADKERQRLSMFVRTLKEKCAADIAAAEAVVAKAQKAVNKAKARLNAAKTRLLSARAAQATAQAQFSKLEDEAAALQSKLMVATTKLRAAKSKLAAAEAGFRAALQAVLEAKEKLQLARMMSSMELKDAKTQGMVNETEIESLLPVPQPPRNESEELALSVVHSVRAGSKSSDVKTVTLQGQMRVDGYSVETFRFAEQRAFRKAVVGSATGGSLTEEDVALTRVTAAPPSATRAESITGSTAAVLVDFTFNAPPSKMSDMAMKLADNVASNEGTFMVRLQVEGAMYVSAVEMTKRPKVISRTMSMGTSEPAMGMASSGVGFCALHVLAHQDNAENEVRLNKGANVSSMFDKVTAWAYDMCHSRVVRDQRSSGRDLKASNEECRNVSSLFKRPGSRPKGPCGFPGGPPCGFASIKAAETLCKTLHGVTKNSKNMRTADAEALYKKHARFYPILPMAPAALRVGSYEHAYDFYPGPGKVRVGEKGGFV